MTPAAVTTLSADPSIKWQIEQELLGDPRTASSHVGIAVQGGTVALSGQVSTLTEKLLLSSLAFRVPGVTAIADAVTVELLTGHRDVDIATSASRALRAAVNLPEDAIQVVVRDGTLTLSGSVAWEFQRDAARNAVSNIPGVRAIIDTVVLEHRAPNTDTVRQLEAAFARSARLRERSLRASCDDGVITLHGTVGSWRECREAVNTAWSAPGTRQVICLLTISYTGQDALMV